MTSAARETATPGHRGDGARAIPGLTLRDLAEASTEELDRLYGSGTVPASLSALDGAPPGRLLALAGPLATGPFKALVARLASSKAFPWRGKTFASGEKSYGRGINRFRLLGERELFPFDMRVEPSVVDGRPCILLDYAKPENPVLVRLLRDELREVAPGLFLGPAMLDLGGRPRVVLYFAIDKTSA